MKGLRKSKIRIILIVFVMVFNLFMPKTFAENVVPIDDVDIQESIDGEESIDVVETLDVDEVIDVEQSIDPVELKAFAPKVLEETIDGFKITIHAKEDTLPDDVRLKVEKLSHSAHKDSIRRLQANEDTTSKEYILFDINLVDSNDEAVQPLKELEVIFEDVNLDVNNQISVYHINNQTIEDMGANVDGDRVVFSTDHFSVYAIANHKTLRYEFYDLEDILIDTQIIIDSGTLLEPATPTKKEGKKFIGWFDVKWSQCQGQLLGSD